MLSQIDGLSLKKYIYLNQNPNLDSFLSKITQIDQSIIKKVADYFDMNCSKIIEIVMDLYAAQAGKCTGNVIINKIIITHFRKRGRSQ